MTIQINSDKTINWEKRSSEYFSSQISDSLKRFEAHITRIEVHLKDVNGKKEGVNDISCLLEARLEGMKPIAVTSQADTVDVAISSATNKAKAAMNTILGKLKNR